MEKDKAFKQRLHAHLNHPGSHGFNGWDSRRYHCRIQCFSQGTTSLARRSDHELHPVRFTRSLWCHSSFKPINDISLLIAETYIPKASTPCSMPWRGGQWSRIGFRKNGAGETAGERGLDHFHDLDGRYPKLEIAPKYLQKSQSWLGAGSSSDWRHS